MVARTLTVEGRPKRRKVDLQQPLEGEDPRIAIKFRERASSNRAGKVGNTYLRFALKKINLVS